MGEGGSHGNRRMPRIYNISFAKHMSFLIFLALARGTWGWVSWPFLAIKPECPCEAEEADESLHGVMRKQLEEETLAKKATVYSGERGGDVPSIASPSASSDSLAKALMGEASSSRIGIQTVVCQLWQSFCFDSQSPQRPSALTLKVVLYYLNFCFSLYFVRFIPI